MRRAWVIVAGRLVLFVRAWVDLSRISDRGKSGRVRAGSRELEGLGRVTRVIPAVGFDRVVCCVASDLKMFEVANVGREIEPDPRVVI